MNPYNTFWNIIEYNEIVVPTIQRDYAYGRKEAATILKNLLLDIKAKLDIEDAGRLHLAFVFGKLEGKSNDQLLQRNTDNIKALLKSVKEYASNLDILVDFDTQKSVARLADNVKFIPIDGQQRLTTLYLLHWYLAIQLKKIDDLKVLQKFQYATRVSSREFCKLICSINPNEVAKDVNDEFITNQEGYFKQWYNDPTVKNMLAVVRQINDIFKESTSKFEVYYKKLKTANTICFDFFDLDNFQQTDDLYVKMNSRGKKLTPFENFKAWLYHKIHIGEEIKKNIDILWYDIFWQAQGDIPNDIDTAYLQWFKNLNLADFLKDVKNIDNLDANSKADLEDYQNTNTGGDYNIKSIIAILRKGDSKFMDLLVGDEKYQQQFLGKIEEYLETLGVIVLNYRNQLNIKVNHNFFSGTIEQLLFTQQDSLNWWQVTFQFSVIKYLSKYNCDIAALIDYLRVISNLIFNTVIDSPNDYLLAIESIEKIVARCDGNILLYLRNTNVDEISFFSPVQKKEEIQKAKLILEDKNWENILIEAENHNYFYGQIGFIVDMCKKPLEIAEFVDVYEKVSVLFSEDVLNESTFLLTRCFLTQGDCFYHEGDNRIFNSNVRGTLRNRTENWRKFFEQKCNFISRLINHKEFDKNDIIRSLNQIIQFELPYLSPSYTSIFVNNYELFVYPKRNHIRKYGEGYYLLNKTRISGYFVELYTYAWLKQNEVTYKQRNPSAKVTYKAAKGEDNDPCIAIEEQGIVCEIKLDYKSGYFVFTKNNFNSEFKTIDEALQNII